MNISGPVLFSLLTICLFGSSRSKLATSLPELLTAVTAPATCEYNGKQYPVGSFQPNPCQPCQCTSSGRAYCAVVDCFFTQCVDYVHDKNQCCPTCPNGRNCRAPDGTVIKYGQSYNPDPNTHCQCNQWSPQAECLQKAPPVRIDTVS
ncbi:hypothetical protein FSP39_021499 [Pinctada imbricata]|uniref:VWFC domain-containing protein n=1 Tax=Pinctada imbricata TaxID=66713 RepID=A0AA88XNH4_PINIB|nr:hypothetical protein FSP39_021499 [Pinctada imbricata]